MSKKGQGFGDLDNPFGEVDSTVNERYIPPNLGAWDRNNPPPVAPPEPQADTVIALDDDVPFTADDLTPTAASSQPQATFAPAPPTLDFTTSVAAPSSDLSGKIGSGPKPQQPQPQQQQVPAVSRLGSALDAASRLLPGSGGGNNNNNASSSSPAGLPVEDPSSYPFYNIKRYRTYFNIDTNEVLHRILRAVVFFFKGDFFDHIDTNPDLYGPFWIASTLIFVSAAAGNTAAYIAFKKSSSSGSGSIAPSPPSTDQAVFYYDVDKVYGSLGLFYGYIGVVGLVLWVILRWWFKAGVGLAQIFCTYGYAMAVFLPMAGLCVLPMEAVRWSLVGAATAISAVFLLLNFRAVVVEAAGATAFPLLLIMLAAHAALGLALKLYFFHYSV